jgi:hypothetical protein
VLVWCVAQVFLSGSEMVLVALLLLILLLLLLLLLLYAAVNLMAASVIMNT